MPKRKRDYRKEYDEYHGTPEQKKRRAARNRARYAAEKRVGKAALRGKEVGHINAPRTGSLDKVPTRIISKKANRKDQPKRK
jgi:hypothetical protein